MFKYFNCVPLDGEATKRITRFSQLCKRIRNKGYTTTQIEQDINFINQQIELTAKEGKTNGLGKCFLVEQAENCHCEPEDICAIFSLYGFECGFDSSKKMLKIEW